MKIISAVGTPMRVGSAKAASTTVRTEAGAAEAKDRNGAAGAGGALGWAQRLAAVAAWGRKVTGRSGPSAVQAARPDRVRTQGWECLRRLATGLLVALVAAVWGAPALAQTTFISNLGQSTGTLSVDATGPIIQAQAFRTGSSPDGYFLHSVQLSLSGVVSHVIS